MANYYVRDYNDSTLGVNLAKAEGESLFFYRNGEWIESINKIESDLVESDDYFPITKAEANKYIEIGLPQSHWL